MRGTLREFPLSEILELVNLSRRSGRVTLTRGNEAATIGFRGGKVISGSDGQVKEPIGSQLVRDGILSPKQLQEALELQRQMEGKLLCELLLELNMVNREDLRRRLRERTEEAIYRLFEWPDGEFFIETSLDRGEGEDPLVSLSPTHLIMEGARRIDEWKRIREKIPSSDIVLQFAPHYALRSEDVTLTHEEWEVISLVNGERDVGAIVSKSPLSPFDTQKILFGLLSSGLLIYSSQLALSSARLEALRQELARLAEETEVRCAVLVDSRGQIILTQGSPAGMDVATIAILSVASLASALEMVRLVGEEGFEILLHQGNEQRVLISGLGRLGALVVLFDTSTPLGVVQLAAKDFVQEVERVFGEVEAAAFQA